MIRFLLVSLLGLLPLSAAAAEPEPAPSRGTVLHLSEPAEREVPRDRLRAVLRVEGEDSDAKRLQSEINRRMAAAVARAKAVPDIAVATGGYFVQQERAQNQPPRWRGSESLTLTTRDAAPLLDLVGVLQQDGLTISALAYELTPEAARSVQDDLTSAAIARLRQRAERIAGELGFVVARISDLRVGTAVGATPPPRFFAAAGGVSAAASAAPVVEPGEATVSLSVEADILLTPKP
jgi:predicted secreted protein